MSNNRQLERDRLDFDRQKANTDASIKREQIKIKRSSSTPK